MSELHEAASTGNLELLEEHLAKGLDPSEPDSEWGGRTPLHLSCGAGHKKCTYVLIQAGADLNTQTDNGWTPAHCACETGQVYTILYSVHVHVHNRCCSVKHSMAVLTRISTVTSPPTETTVAAGKI